MRSPSSDPLAALISLLRPQAVFSKVVSGVGRWSIRYDRYQDPGFCLLLEGSCFLDVDGLGLFELNEGDFLFLPEVPAFTMGNDLRARPTRVSPDHSRTIRHGARVGPVTMRQLAGYFQFERANARLLVKLLPPVVHVRRDAPGGARLRRIVELIDEEVDAGGLGRELVLERLVEVLLVEALRSRPAGGAEGLLAGLADPGLARALRRIHTDVARGWTIAELGRVAGMSRSVFAERFTRKVGLPPMQYLLEWRMALAKDLLKRERPPLAEVAERVGYQSASAFSTAFTRLIGVPPSEFARG